jgi:phosphohistidine phosphatase
VSEAAILQRRLTLVRHGQAEWKDDGSSDFDRVLHRRGNAEATGMARRCREQGWLPDLIHASSALRTQQTAQCFMRELDLPARRLQLSESMYLAGHRELLAVARAAGPRIAHLMLVGHNPGLTEFAQFLAPSAGLGIFDTGALCTMVVDLSDWAGLDAGQAREVHYEAPRRLFDFLN